MQLVGSRTRTWDTTAEVLRIPVALEYSYSMRAPPVSTGSDTTMLIWLPDDLRTEKYVPSLVPMPCRAHEGTHVRITEGNDNLRDK